MTLSPQTQELLNVIKTYTKEHGYNPNRVQLGKLLQKDRRTIDRRLQDMEAQGLIKRGSATTVVPGDYTVL